MPKVDKGLIGFTVALLLALAGASHAQKPQKPGSTPAEAPAAASQDAASQPPPAAGCTNAAARVVDVYNGVPGNRTVRLRDTITIQVEGLDGLRQEAECRGQAAAGKPEDIVLYVDERPLPELVASPPTDPNEKILRFPLRRTETSRDAWTAVLGRPDWAPRKTRFSIGLADRYAISDKGVKPVLLEVIPHNLFLFWLLLFFAFLIGFFVLARRSDLLRDPAPQPGGDARRPYSLARSQASWWFFLILASYLLIGMTTGDFSTSITSTCLVLMGISAGTAVGSAFIDASKSTPETALRQGAAQQNLAGAVEKLAGEVKAEAVLNPNDPATAQDAAVKKTELAAKLSQLRKARNESESFILDILSDANGVNFHRFQMLAWTVVLGIIFAGNVYRDLAMPDFSTTLLALMGISAGTYLGLKIPEDTVPKTDP